MTLSLYFLRQFIPSFAFGSAIFLFVLMMDKLFDIIDLLFNRGVGLGLVLKLFSLFIPIVLPLTFPMALLLACLVTFGRLSEENELSAVRATGIPLHKVLWGPPLLGLFLSLAMVPFNTHTAPWANRAFRALYEKIASSDPLINIESRRFFSIKNVKIYAEEVDKKNNLLKNVFLFQTLPDNRPAERIYAQQGKIDSTSEAIVLRFTSGQLQRYDADEPTRLLHTQFNTYTLSLPMKKDESGKSTRFRNISSPDLKNQIKDLKKRGLPVSPLEAEYSLRFAMAFAPLSLVLLGVPLAAALKRGGRGFSMGVAIVVIFVYYTLLIFGLTLAEKGSLPSHPALWMANAVSLAFGVHLFFRLFKQ